MEPRRASALRRPLLQAANQQQQQQQRQQLQQQVLLLQQRLQQQQQQQQELAFALRCLWKGRIPPIAASGHSLPPKLLPLHQQQQQQQRQLQQQQQQQPLLPQQGKRKIFKGSLRNLKAERIWLQD
ncbi:hypothetical protein Efla_005081 [Eimeria flavescens]